MEMIHKANTVGAAILRGKMAQFFPASRRKGLEQERAALAVAEMLNLQIEYFHDEIIIREL